MKFTHWLESQNNSSILFSSFSKDGTVIVYVNGTRYVYITDAFNHGQWNTELEWTKKHRPKNYEKVALSFLNEIKKMTSRGFAKQVEPKTPTTPPIPTPTVASPPDKPKKYIQRTLF